MKCPLLALFLALGVSNAAIAQQRGGTRGFQATGQTGANQMMATQQGGQFGATGGQMGQNTMGGMTGGNTGTNSGFGSRTGNLGNAGGFGTGSGLGGTQFGSQGGSQGGSMGGAGTSGLGSAMAGLGGGMGMPAGFGNFSPYGGGMGMGGMGMSGMGMSGIGMGGMGGMGMGGIGGMGRGGMGGMGGRNGGNNQFGNQNQNNKSKIRTSVRVGFAPTPVVATVRAASIQNRIGRVPTTVRVEGVQVLMQDRTAVLRGVVDSQADAQMLQRLISLEPGVDAVINELSYAGQSANAATANAASPALGSPSASSRNRNAANGVNITPTQTSDADFVPSALPQ